MSTYVVHKQLLGIYPSLDYSFSVHASEMGKKEQSVSGPTVLRSKTHDKTSSIVKLPKKVHTPQARTIVRLGLSGFPP